MSGDLGGLAKTVNYKGNRIDIGGHRFFSKSDRVMEWWMKMMPIAAGPDTSFIINYQNKTREINPAMHQNTPKDPDTVMLVRERLSRIYYLKKFFDYPVSLSGQTI